MTEWPNRDPLGEFGFELIRHPRIIKHRRSFRSFGEIKGTPDLYEFVRNSPVARIDLLGLDDNDCGCGKQWSECVLHLREALEGGPATLPSDPSGGVPGGGDLLFLILGQINCSAQYSRCMNDCFPPNYTCPRGSVPVGDGAAYFDDTSYFGGP
jgi:hypothetical protein